MKAIKIRQHGDIVYYLTSQGFEKGQVKKTIVVSEKHTPLCIKYFVNDDISTVFMGHERSPEQLWDTYEEMLSHFKANPPK